MIFSIQNACKNRSGPTLDDASFDRIITAYQKAKSIQIQAPEIYKVGNEWAPIYEKHMDKAINVLLKGDKTELRHIYNNFFRESCSSGLHGMLLEVENHFANDEINPAIAETYFNDSIHRLNLWQELTEGRSGIASLVSPDVGNPYGYFLDGIFIRAGSDYQHYYSTVINRLISNPNEKQVVAEIGGGYGGMAYFLLRDNSNICYIDFDLPENVALTSFYLLSAFPEKRIALFGEIDLDTDDIKSYDAVLLPNFQLGKLSENSVDLTFNSYSLAEMSRETINGYLAFVNGFTKKFFFHVNHTKNILVKSHEFNIDRNKFELLYRAPALWNMARNKNMDEFEHLYKRAGMTFISPH
jgi:putative sugar O-methyltransferase